MKMEFDAYHGTLQSHARDIVTQGYTYSVGNEHWLGDGVYFFIEGIGYSPDKAAELWAEFRAHKSHTQFCASIKSLVNVDDSDMLDLTSYEGIVNDMSTILKTQIVKKWRIQTYEIGRSETED